MRHLALLALLLTGCIYDYGALNGTRVDASEAPDRTTADAEPSMDSSTSDAAIGSSDSSDTNATRDALDANHADVAADGIDAGGAGGTDGGAGRPLGAGCTADAQCGSTICDKATSTCCDARVDGCNVCIAGYKTPANEGAMVGTCGKCQAGTVTPIAEGMPCGDATCSGSILPTGFPSGDTYHSSSDAHVCHAGQCTVTTIDCTTINCPSTCAIKYRGCVSGPCWCVDMGGSVCN
ncbi:MAG: hypothetical protein JWM82_1828 [Myxococcales bacterium]|nr:hypothetical protein [Myxococcales bacterium]